MCQQAVIAVVIGRIYINDSAKIEGRHVFNYAAMCVIINIRCLGPVQSNHSLIITDV